MPGQPIGTNNKPYLSIVSGNIVQKVDKDTPGARLREYETKDGATGSKWELVYMNWTGQIHGITFKDGDFGTMCNIDLGDAFLTLGTSSRYFSDFASKVFNADLSQEITFHPYDMEGDGDKKIQGISLQQNGVKLKSYFRDENNNPINDFPVVDEAKKEKLKKNYWKTYFAEVEAFLIEKLGELKITQTEAKPQIQTEPMDAADLPDLTPDEGLPF